MQLGKIILLLLSIVNLGSLVLEFVLVYIAEKSVLGIVPTAQHHKFVQSITHSEKVNVQVFKIT